ncbi:MAG: ester cyclase [Acidimicrobiia bacterium]
MRPAEMVNVVQEHLAFEKAHDAVSAAACYVDDGYYVHTPLGLRLEGRGAVEFNYASNYAAMPDVTFDIEGEVVGDNGLMHWATMRGTLDGTFLGQEPTHRSVALPFVARYEFRDGKILGETLWFDLYTLCDQGGLDIVAVRTTAAELAAALA